jgi:tetratricopeptide (TPR) repeat protein
MRSLGRFYLRESQLERAAECFELSLEINPLFDEIWFNLGSIYLRLDDSGEAACEHKKKAMNAFVRCVNVNPEHVQGWVNLSAVYSECGLEYIQEAKQAAGEAVKLAPQAWQFWENYTLISARAEDWQNALRGEQKLSLSLNRSDHPDLNMVRMMVVNIKSSALRVRLLGFLEDLVLKNKQTVEILKILTDMYVEFGRFEEAFKTVTCQLKEILGLVGTVGEANSLYSAQDLLTEAIQCLGRMSEMLDSNHLRSIEGITAGIGLTVRSVPRRIAAISGGQDLPQLKTFCDKIQKTVESWSSLAE